MQIHEWVILQVEHDQNLGKIQKKKQCRGEYFGLYGIAYWIPSQQKHTTPVLIFSDFAGWVTRKPFPKKV